jgi:hypothetical protein
LRFIFIEDDIHLRKRWRQWSEKLEDWFQENDDQYLLAVDRFHVIEFRCDACRLTVTPLVRLWSYPGNRELWRL